MCDNLLLCGGLRNFLNSSAMTVPKFKMQILIKCLTCSQYVKADGITITAHFELHHLTIPGEKSAICKRCCWKIKTDKRLSAWRIGEEKTVNDTE